MKVVPEFDDAEMVTGYITVTKVDDEKGRQIGKMPLNEVADLLRQVFDFDAAGRQVKMISRFAESPFLAWGQNGGKWIAIKVIEPGEYFLVSVSGQAYKVQLPRLIAVVGNHSPTSLFWTSDEQLQLKSKLFPLMIGNIANSGWVCLGSSGLKCNSPDEIDKYVRQVVEVPATGTYLPAKTNMDKLFQSLTEKWDPTIGASHGISLEELLASTE